MLEPLGEGLWQSRFDLFAGGVHFPGRMVVARLSDGGLWLWSPVPIDDALAAAITELGPVAHIVAPNAFHHLQFRSAAERFGDAKRWLTPALAKKRPTLEHDELLTGEAPEVWADTLDQLLVGGIPKVDEAVFCHRPSKTLIVTDLIFNILEYQGWMSGLVYRMAGTHKKCAQSRLLRSGVRDRKAAGDSVRAMMKWDFDRVVMAHGEVLEDNAREQLQDALTWMLNA